jgi:hypothetical protein
LIPHLKKSHRLWRIIGSAFLGSLKRTLTELIGLLARRAVYRGPRESLAGNAYRLFESHVASRRYFLWTLPDGAIVAIRDILVEQEFFGEPGASANSLHEALLRYYRYILENQGYEVRMDKQLGKMVGDKWQLRKSMVRPDLQVYDPRTRRMFHVEVDSKTDNSREHRQRLQRLNRNVPLIFVTFDMQAGEPKFQTSLATSGPARQARTIGRLFQSGPQKTWSEDGLMGATMRAWMRNRQERQKRVAKAKGPAAAGAVTRVRRPARRQREFELEHQSGFAFS